MSRAKLKKFQELADFKNVAQVNDRDIKNKLKKFSLNSSELILELACGRAEYSLALAKKHPNKKYIAIDIQGERLWHGAKTAQEEKIDNIFFLRAQIENLLDYFDQHSVDQIWITFPDPFPREKQIKKRLTSPRFLDMYKKILKDKNLLHLKTDDKNLYNYSLEAIKEAGANIEKTIENIYKQKDIPAELKIKTTFEKKHLANNKSINYIAFRL